MKLPPILVYSVLRLLAFLVPFGVLMLFPIFRTEPWNWVAAVCAMLIGVSLSVLFLRRPLDEVSTSMYERREARGHTSAATTDADVEDAAIDAEPAAQPGDQR